MGNVNMKPNGASWIAVVGLMSAAALGLEITLANLFGVLLQYHYVSFIVSLAVFGIGVGAYAAYRPLKKEVVEVGGTAAGWVCASAGLFIAVLSFILAKFPYVGQLWVYALLCMVPFLLTGWIMGRALVSGTAPAAVIYSADLLGAGAGAAGAYALLNRFGGFASVFAISALCFAAAVIIFLQQPKMSSDGQQRWSGIALTAVATLLLAAVPFGLFAGVSHDAWRLDYAGVQGAAPDKTIVGTLKADPAASVLRTDWDSFSRTDTVSTSDASRRILFVDGGAGSYMYKFDGNLNSVSSLARDIEFLPFAAGSANKTAIVGAGGGRDILYALMAGAKDVTAVELSPGLVKSVRSFAGYNGSILDRPGVHTVIGDGRSVLERSPDSYDLIVLDLVYSQIGGIGGQALAENFVFTREAFAAYLQRLNPDGRIIVISHQGIEGIRAYYTGFESLLQSGGIASPGEAARHTALLMAPEGSASPNLTVSVIQKSPLSNSQLTLLQAGAQSLGLNALFLPGSNEQLLKPLLNGSVPFDKFVRDSDFNVYPTTDDRPFFFQIEPGVPASLWQWMIAIAALTILFAIYVMRRETAQRSKRKSAGQGPGVPAKRQLLSARPLIYYVLLGIGYMCIQTVLIQRTMMYAGSPALAAMVIIVAMLLGGSLGSLLSGRFRIKVSVASAVIIVLTVGLALFEALFSDQLMSLAVVPRLAAIGVGTLLLGIPLGMPLPAGLRADEERVKGASPYFFAVNGIAGVWGSWLAVLVSLVSGIAVTLAAGCFCYLLLGVMQIIQLRRQSI